MRPTFLSIAAIALVATLTAWGGAAAQAPDATSPSVPPSTCNRAAFRLIVDVGHTEELPGATSARGAKEYDFNLALATRIHHTLVESGFEKTILLVTGGKSRPGLAQRIANANKSSADLFLSIHHDSVPNKFLEKWEFEGTDRVYSDRFRGHSIFVSRDNRHPAASVLFGRLLGLALKSRGLTYTPHYTERFMGSRRRILVDAKAGVYRYDQLLVLKNTHMPAVLLEAGSIINRDEELLMGTPEHQAVIAAAATEAVDAFCARQGLLTPLAAAKRTGAAPQTKQAPAR